MARYSAATERALARVVERETIYAAAKKEGISYNTLWKAVKRISGEMEAGESTFQKVRNENKELHARIDELTDTLRALHEYAQQGPAYARDPLFAKVDMLLRPSPTTGSKGRHGAVKGRQAPRRELTDDAIGKIKLMLQQSAGGVSAAHT